MLTLTKRGEKNKYKGIGEGSEARRTIEDPSMNKESKNDERRRKNAPFQVYAGSVAPLLLNRVFTCSREAQIQLSNGKFREWTRSVLRHHKMKLVFVLRPVLRCFGLPYQPLSGCVCFLPLLTHCSLELLATGVVMKDERVPTKQ